MIDFSKIKLIIWDLDDTFWKGTLSEGGIQECQNCELIKLLTDRGIVNAVCSKNDKQPSEEELHKLGVLDYFVFNSIDWTPKGPRIKTMIKEMGLRPVNVLFIDDNTVNLNEAKHYSPEIMISEPVIIPLLKEFFKNQPATDVTHKRLNQYKVLENKKTASKKFSDNEDFLYDCDIHVQIEADCNSIESRLYELTQRTNQLNYTKNRPSKEEFHEQLKCCDDCGYVKVQDKFGDYGVVGFYLIRESKVVHFLFSCRTIGQGVEQFVYAKLGFPKLEVVGDVATQLDSQTIPAWINEGSLEEKASVNTDLNVRLLFKGPCDMSGMVGYLQMDDVLTTEFTFTDNEGHLVESQNHSAHISALKLYSSDILDTLEKECFFFKRDNIESCLFSEFHKIVFLSTLIESNYGVYRRIGTGELITFGHYDCPLTDRSLWDKYINGEIINFGYKITKEMLEAFSKKYEYIGRTTPDQYVMFIKNMLSWLPKDTHICLILGSEIQYEGEKSSTYMDRHARHKEFNAAVEGINDKRLHTINVTKYIKSQNDFTNNINHFVPSVYYKLSQEIKSLVVTLCGDTVQIKTNWRKFFVKQYIMPIANMLLPKKIFWIIHSKLRKRI